jgi:multiple sugar transport system permease protein
MTSDVQTIAKDRMRYTKDKFSSMLAILAIVFDCLFFVSIYQSDVGTFYYNWLIGVSIVYNLIFLLVIFTMIVPHKTVQYALYMFFRYFDFLGIFKLLGGGVIAGLDIFPDYVNGETAEIWKRFTTEGVNLMNTHWPMAIMSLTGLGFKNGLYVFMLRNFFIGVPDELEESAYLDGSGPFQTFFRVILPLSVPTMITVFLFAFCWQWTDQFYSQTFYTDMEYYLMYKIVEIPDSLVTNYAGQNLYYSAIRNGCAMLIIMPLIILYLFCQRYLVQGIERTGITG